MKILLIIMGVLEIWDGILTDSFVRNGTVLEANRLMESVVMNGDFIYLKITGAILGVLLLWRVYRRYPKIAISTAGVIATFYGAVILWNLGILFGI